jgi:uncharacterized membrane protein
MTWMLLGLVLFLGAHSLRVFAEGWRSQLIGRLGEKTFKGIYAVVSLLGFVLLCWGYDQARATPTVLWVPPVATRHVAALLMLFASVLLVAAYVPGNHLKTRMRHPMVLSVKVWALSHLLANGNLEDVILFATFLVWAVLCFRAARARDRAADLAPVVPQMRATLVAVMGGVVLYAVFLFKAHAWLVGVSPMGL